MSEELRSREANVFFEEKARIEALERENERLRTALEHIAADRLIPIGPDTNEHIYDLCDYRKRVALSALAKKDMP